MVYNVAMTEEIRKRFQSLACQLSPENLCCDGELSPEETNKRYKELIIEWKNLEIEAGETVSEETVWNWMFNNE